MFYSANLFSKNQTIVVFYCYENKHLQYSALKKLNGDIFLKAASKMLLTFKSWF